jgi:hypothetical protein
MAVTTYPAFTPTGRARLSVSSASVRAALSTTGTPTSVLVTNLGQEPAFVLLGSSAVVSTVTTGLTVLPGDSIFLAIGSNTDLAAVTQSGGTALTLDLGS